MRRMAALLLIAAPIQIAAAAEAIPLAAHHAVYALSLSASASGQVVAAHGTMTYDVQDACSGWTTAQRLRLVFTNRDGQDIHMVSDYATFETKDGTHLRFHTRQTTDDAVTSQLDGTAVLGPRGGRATYDAQGEAASARVVALPAGTRLPLAHTEAILTAAAQGRKFLQMPLFDGTAAAGAEDTFVTIEGWQKPSPQPWPSLSPLWSGRVHVSFFDRGPAAQTPDYEIGMRYFSDGVADALSMDFGDFTVRGELDSFQLKPASSC